MNRQFVLSLLVLGASALAAPLAVAAPPAAPATVQLRGETFSVELATTSAARQRGLMNRKELAADHGMLFVFPVAGRQAFWMKNTLVPLDILYFDDDRRLVSMQTEADPCKADPCMIYPSGAIARYALEVPAGTAQLLGVKIGDPLTINAAIGPVR